MDLLDFARGPGLLISVSVFLAGIAWRLVALWRLPSQRDLSAPRTGTPNATVNAWQGIRSGLWPRGQFGPPAQMAATNAYLFHIGLALVFFGFTPHVAFLARYLGFSWPTLPDPVIYLATAVTMLSLLMALWLRLSRPVLRLISRFDDYLTWAITFAPLITGMAIISDSSNVMLARSQTLYRTPLAIHLLTLELLLVWFPFGKLMHAVLFFFSRAATGKRFGHRGVPQ